ncbi:MAG: hypothetical protein ACRC18_07190 [Cetobacterium sp.]
MATQLEVVYRPFLNSIEDEEWLLIQDDEVIADLLLDYLEKATVDFNKCKKSLKIDYEFMSFYEELDMDEIVILSKAMILHYLDPKILREQNLKQSVTSKDFNKLSNANMLDKLIKLKEFTRKELDRYLSDYDYKGFAGF